MILFVSNSFSQVTITGTSTTNSDCPNNGSITVNATQTTTGSLLYSIVDGPQTQGQQSSNVFTSLLPGEYTVQVEDFFNNSDSEIITVLGSYRELAFTPDIESQITCIGSNDAVIVGDITSFTGKAPFDWEIISPIAIGPQTSDRFENLGPGVYTIKVTDACGEADTRIVELEEDLNGLSINYPSSIVFTSCTEAEVGVNIDVSSYAPPIEITTIINGVPEATTITDESYSEWAEYLSLDVSISDISYGDKLEMSVTDACNRSVIVYDNLETVKNFSFCASSSSSNANCGVQVDASINSIFSECNVENEIRTTFHTPIDYDLKNITAGTSETGEINSYSDYDIEDISASSDYELTLTDNCGNTDVVTFTSISLPSVGTPSVSVDDTEPSGCLDAAAIQNVYATNFSSEPFLILTSGPTSMTNDKKGFEYDYNLVYPDTVTWSSGSPYGTGFEINSLPIGVYTFDMEDTCGNSVPGTFEITEADLSDLQYELSVTRDCLGNNKIEVNSNAPSGTYEIYSYNAGVDEDYRFYWELAKEYTFNNLSPNDYNFTFSEYSESKSPIDDMSGSGFHDCFEVDSLIIIEPYTDPLIKTYNTIICDESVFVELLIDSTTGIGPYEFEIFEGPVTFPLQSENLFELTTIGLYKARIQDACGNTRVREISISNLEIEPLNSDVNCSSAEIIYPSSSYFLYEWTKPNGTKFVGDTLSIALIEASDTGLYTVVQNVSIGSCIDQFTQSYQLDMVRTSEYEEVICPGTTIVYAGNVVSSAGDYTDTLSAADGCDSLVTMHLSFYDYNYGNTSATICPGGSTTIEGEAYNTDGVFYDTLSTLDCDSVLEITIDYSPYLQGSYAAQICELSSVMIEGKNYNMAGVFYDTISNGSCDSILEITITEISYLRDTIDAYFCDGSSVSVRGNSYSLAGQYIDTLSNATFCDSIIVNNIEEKSLPSFDLGNDTIICQNSSVTFKGPSGYSSYSWNTSLGTINTVNYTTDIAEQVTLQVIDEFGCIGQDNIEVLSLSPLPVVTINNPEDICLNESTDLIATGAATYSWSPNVFETNGSIEVAPTSTTIYSVIGYSSFNCSSESVSTTVVVKPVPTEQLIDEDIMYHCFLESPLTVTPNWGESFLWTPSLETSTELIVEAPESYVIEVLDEYECNYSDSFSVVNKCVTVIAVPDAFSPNYDGLHDELEIKGKNFTDFEMRIFNRWGELIYVTDDINDLWNGMYRDEHMPVGSYPWVINYRTIDGNLEEKKLETIHGSVSIIR